MKIYQTLCLGAVIALTQSAMAQLPIANDTLGLSEGMLAFCSKENPKAAAKYRELGKESEGNATVKDLADAKASKEYKESFALIKTRLEKLPQHEAAKVCTEVLESK